MGLYLPIVLFFTSLLVVFLVFTDLKWALAASKIQKPLHAWFFLLRALWMSTIPMFYVEHYVPRTYLGILFVGANAAFIIFSLRLRREK
jgi:hypothetical protein